MNKSEFKPIPGLESYVINEFGVIKALPKIREGRLDNLKNHSNTTKKSKRKYKERIIKQTFKQRYWYVCLMHNGIKKSYRVHRLVYISFIGDIPNNKVIDHIDGNTSNNHVSNLRCVTYSENRMNPTTYYKSCKKVLKLNLDTNEVIKKYNSITEAMVDLGFDYKKSLSSHIGDVCNGKHASAYGYRWKWEEGPQVTQKEIRKAKHVLQFDMQGNFIKEYKSTYDAAFQNGFSVSNINKCVNNKQTHHKNYIWKYKEEV